jgi:hypothetical protein
MDWHTEFGARNCSRFAATFRIRAADALDRCAFWRDSRPMQRQLCFVGQLAVARCIENITRTTGRQHLRKP